MNPLQDKNGTADTVQYLSALLALAVAIALGVVYVFIEPQPGSPRILKLLIDIIPDAVVVLIAIPVVYFLFYQRGLTFSQLKSNIDVGELAKSIAIRLPSRETEGPPPPLLAFHESYRFVDWKGILCESQNHIDIVVYYFDSWVNANYENLVSFFSKPRTTMRVFVADPSNESNFACIHRLFPEYSEDVVREKVSNTGKRIAAALQEAGGNLSRFEFYLVPHTLNYSAQCIDHRILVLGWFEMYRKLKIDSPVVLIDLAKSPHLTRFWDKELQGLLATSKRVDVC